MEVIKAAAGESYFEDDSLIRRVNDELVVAFSGGRALMMQAAHPVMFEGFYQETSSSSDIHGRLRRTAYVMNTIYYGSRDEADRLTAAVRQMHSQVRGHLKEAVGSFPAGVEYRADDPKYLLWTLATLFSSADLFYRRYVHRLSVEERDLLWNDYCLVGTLFGLDESEMPPTAKEVDNYLTLMGDELYVSARAREIVPEIILNPPVPFYYRPLVEAVNLAIIGSLPPSVRRGYRLRWNPLLEIAYEAGTISTHLTLPHLPGFIRKTPLAGGILLPRD